MQLPECLILLPMLLTLLIFRQLLVLYLHAGRGRRHFSLGCRSGHGHVACHGRLAVLGFLREPLSRRHAASIGLAVVGVVMLVWAREPNDANASLPPHSPVTPWWGYALLVAAVFCEASYVVIGKRLSAHLSAQRISGWINLWGLALVTPWGLWQAWTFDFPQVAWSSWGLLLCYAVAASVVTVWLWMRGLQQVPAAQAGVFTLFLPISSALVGVGALGEPLGVLHAVAFVTALAGLLMATWPASPRA